MATKWGMTQGGQQGGGQNQGAGKDNIIVMIGTNRLLYYIKVEDGAKGGG